ncbi:ParA family protein [Acetobacterium sp.]|uniref:ParA family protein n=1 Tax=Acetobacterium sp. TaxID=1872094 RepID=UPI002F42B29F
MNKCTTIAILNQKGGVGKTTTTYNLGWELGKLGKKVLLVDFDSQGNLTMQAGVMLPDKLNITIADFMMAQMKDIPLPEDDIIIKKEMVDVLPCNITLSGVGDTINGVMEREFVLDGVLEKHKEEYDYILIDCQPTLGMLPINAMATCDKVIIPVVCELWPIKGLEAVLKSIAKVKRRMNTKIEVAGILITKYEGNLSETKYIEGIINDVFSKKVHIFESKIVKCAKLGQAGREGLSASEKIKTIGSKRERENIEKVVDAYETVAKEIIMSNEKQRGITNGCK